MQRTDANPQLSRRRASARRARAADVTRTRVAARRTAAARDDEFERLYDEFRRNKSVDL